MIKAELAVKKAELAFKELRCSEQPTDQNKREAKEAELKAEKAELKAKEAELKAKEAKLEALYAKPSKGDGDDKLIALLEKSIEGLMKSIATAEDLMLKNATANVAQGGMLSCFVLLLFLYESFLCVFAYIQNRLTVFGSVSTPRVRTLTPQNCSVPLSLTWNGFCRPENNMPS